MSLMILGSRSQMIFRLTWLPWLFSLCNFCRWPFMLLSSPSLLPAAPSSSLSLSIAPKFQASLALLKNTSWGICMFSDVLSSWLSVTSTQSAPPFLMMAFFSRQPSLNLVASFRVLLRCRCRNLLWSSLNRWVSAFYTKLIRSNRNRTSNCFCISSLLSSRDYMVFQLGFRPTASSSMYTMQPRKMRRLNFWAGTGLSSSWQQRCELASISKEYSVYSFMNSSAISTKPNSPPMQEKVSSTLLKPRVTMVVVLALRKTKLARNYSVTWNGTSCPRELIMPPLSTFSDLRGLMLSSVVISQSEMKMLTREEQAVVKRMKFLSSRQQVMQSCEPGLMSVLSMQTLKWKVLFSKSDSSAHVLLGESLLHRTTSTSAYWKTSDVNLPCMGISCPILGQSISSNLILWKSCTNQSLMFQCYSVHFSSSIFSSRVTTVFYLLRMVKLTSNFRSVLLLRSSPEICTANMNLLLPEIEAVSMNSSMGTSTVFRDHMMSVLAKVLIITLMKMAQKVNTVATEQKAPVMVRQAGSSLQRRNYEVAKISHLRKKSFSFYLQPMPRITLLQLNGPF